MKKLLSFLLSFSLISASTAVVMACGPKETPNDDEEDIEDQLKLRNQFESEVKAEFNQRIILASKNLNHLSSDEGTSINNKILTTDFIDSKLVDEIKTESENTTSKIITLDASQKLEMISDLSNKLPIKNITKSIYELMREKSEYSFLMQSEEESLFNNFEILDEIEVSRQEEETKETKETLKIYNIKFQCSSSFNVYLSGNPEKVEISPINLSYNILTGEVLVELLGEVVYQLPTTLWDEERSQLQFTEIKLSSQNYFLNQDAGINNYLKDVDEENQIPLKRTIAETIEKFELEDSTTSMQVAHDFTLEATTLKMLYNNSISPVIKTDGFIEQAMFLKGNDGLSEEQVLANKKASFLEEFSNFNIGSFVSTSVDEIKTLLNLDINLSSENDQNATDFVEYGRIRIDNLEIQIGSNLTLRTNPIDLLYTYKPTVEIEDSLIELLTQWQTSWNIAKSSDRGALWKIRETNDDGESIPLAVEFWNQMESNPTYFAKNWPRSMYTPALINTGFSKFSIGSTNGAKNPYAIVNDLGYRINYSGYGKNPTNDQLAKSWKLIIQFDNIKITLNLARNENYFENVWYAKDSSKLLFERT